MPSIIVSYSQFLIATDMSLMTTRSSKTNKANVCGGQT